MNSGSPDENSEDPVENRPGRSKVVFIIDHLRIGGAQKVLGFLVAGLNKYNYDVTVLNCRAETLSTETMRLNGVDVRSLDMPKISLFVVKNLRKIIRALKPHVVHTHLDGSNTFGAAAALAEQVPVVIRHDHSGRTGADRRYRLKRILAEKFVGSGAHVVAVSKDVAAFNVSIGVDPASLTIIGNGIDLARFSQPVTALSELGFFDGKYRIVGFVGRLCWYKGLEYLIEAAPRILREAPSTKFVIVGDGPDRKKISMRISQAGLSKSFVLVGYQPEVERWYNTFDVTVVPSIYESFGLSVIESMAAAKPVVAFRVGGVGEIIEDGLTGSLTAPRDVKALAESVINFLVDPIFAAKIGATGKKMVNERYSVENTVNQVAELYKRLLIEREIKSVVRASRQGAKI